VASTAAGASRLSFAEVRARALAAAPALAARLETESVALDEAVGRVLAAPLIAAEPFPRFDNSSVDGYALRARDTRRASAGSPVRLSVIERVGAGHVPARGVLAGEAVLLMTGAPLPPGADAVVMRESVRAGAGEVWLAAPAEAGENVRPRGDDLAAGETVFARGRVLAPCDLAPIAALGNARVSAVRRPRVAILSTGDELREPGEPLAPGEVYDANSYVLRALVRAAGAEPGETWRVRDDVSVVAEALRGLLAGHDVVLSLGGVSAGDFDVVKGALAAFPGFELWRVAMRPGGPQAFGVADGRVFHGLPGNPVSSAVVFDRLTRPLLRSAMGAVPDDRPVVRATLAERARSARGRREFVRVTLEPGKAPGTWVARLTGTQSSGAVSSLAKADGLGVIPEPLPVAEKGEEIDVILWPDV
jgi:molybdopterin molybdotransferase